MIKKDVIIVGAGPAGLMLGNLLDKDFLIFSICFSETVTNNVVPGPADLVKFIFISSLNLQEYPDVSDESSAS